jgi:hypothetical protein
MLAPAGGEEGSVPGAVASDIDPWQAEAGPFDWTLSDPAEAGLNVSGRPEASPSVGWLAEAGPFSWFFPDPDGAGLNVFERSEASPSVGQVDEASPVMCVSVVSGLCRCPEADPSASEEGAADAGGDLTKG